MEKMLKLTGLSWAVKDKFAGNETVRTMCIYTIRPLYITYINPYYVAQGL